MVLVTGGPITITTTAVIPVPGDIRSIGLQPTWTMFAHTGEDGVSVAGLLGGFSGTVVSAWVFNSDQQRWLAYFPGFLFLTEFTTVDHLDVLFVRVGSGSGVVTITERTPSFVP